MQLEELIAFARHQLELDRPEKDGQSQRAHLEAAASQSEAARQALAGPGCPEALRYVWDWFLELNAGRTGSGFGPNPLAWSEVEAWARLSRLRLTGFERDALRALDAVFVRTFSEKKGNYIDDSRKNNADRVRADR